MAHDFLGTFNKSQLDRFLNWARAQLPTIDARIEHLTTESIRMGIVVFRFEQGVPVEFVVNPATSYLGQLMAAYEVQGGNPFLDLRVRLRNDPIFAVRGSERKPVSYMSNGEVIGAKGLADAPSAELVRRARAWLDDTLHARYGRLERKIRRVLDYSDQLQAEAARLQVIRQSVDVDASLEQTAEALQQLISDPNYRAIFDDGGNDRFAFNVYAPFGSYDVAPSADPNLVDRIAETPQRQDGGFVGPGQKGTA